jgi:chromosome segregation ATPase
MLEPRVAALEADMREVKSILFRMEPLLRGIDERVQRLDGRMDRSERRDDALDERLRKVEIDVAETKGRVSQLPTAWTYMTTGFGPIIATFGFVFAVLKFVIPS